MNRAYRLKEKWTFSKWLAVVTSAFFFGIVTFALWVWFKQDRVPSKILSTVAVPFSSVTAFYFIKSGYENGKKIDGSIYDPSSVPVDPAQTVQPTENVENQNF
jgi:hypothetical protein